MINKAKVLKLLDKLRPKDHYECEDNYYSCPQHLDSHARERIAMGIDDVDMECYCGFEKNNKIIDEIIELIKEEK